MTPSGDRLPLLQQALRFGVVGVLASSTHLATYLALVAFGGLSPTLATVVGFLLGTAVSFVLNATLTFQAPMTRRTATRFTLVTLAGGGVNTAVVAALTAASVDYRLAGVLAVVVGAAVNFTGHKVWTFRPLHEGVS